MTNAWCPLLHLPAHELVRPVALVRRHPARLDRLAARRHLVDDRHVEVAVDREGERARDWRRRHDEHVRVATLFPQRRPLHHAEPVLLVDDREAEAVEIDALLDHRVRPDDDVDLTHRYLLLQLPFDGRGRASGEERDRQRLREIRRPYGGDRDGPLAAPEDLTERMEVLLRQYLRRRHHRPLCAGRRRRQQRRRRNDRLAAADVALDKAAHWAFARHVGQRLCHRPLLGAGQRERQRLDVAVADLIRQAKRLGAAALLPLAFPLQHAGLNQQQLVEGETTSRGLEIVPAVREVHLPERLRPRQHAVARKQRRRQKLRQRAGVGVERLLRQPSHGASGQPRRCVIDGHQSPRMQQFLRLQRLVLRVVQRLLPLVQRHLAREDDALVRAKLLRHPGLVEPDNAHHPRLVADERLGATQSTADRRVLCAPDRADHRLLLADDQLGDRPDTGEVVIAPGEEEKEVLHRRDAQAGQLRRKRRCSPPSAPLLAFRATTPHPR